MPIRYHFPSSSSAWIWLQSILAAGCKVTNYGFDPYRSVNPYFVEVM